MGAVSSREQNQIREERRKNMICYLGVLSVMYLRSKTVSRKSGVKITGENWNSKYM